MILHHRETVRALIITERQAGIISMAKAGVGSGDVALMFGTSIPSASIQLKKLYDMGYLLRNDHGDPTGGTEYVYTLQKGLEGIV